MKLEIYRLVLKQFMVFCIWVVLARISKGFALPIMAIFGIIWAFNSKFGKAFSIYAMLLFMVVLNPFILPKSSIVYTIGLRFGPLIVGLALAMRSMTITSKEALPMGLMIAYLVISIVSSIGGWCPPVSYLKLANFAIFFIGIWLGSKGLQFDADGVVLLRATMLSLAAFLVVGSVVTLPFPGISTLNSFRILSEFDDLGVRNQIIKEMIDSGGMTLFCGVTAHSQMLSPLLVCAFSFVICDMLFVEGGFRWPHAFTLACALPLLYMTRSRTALLGLVVILSIIYFYLPRKLSLNRRMRKWVGQILLVGGGCLIVLALVSEIRGNAISRWVRKTDDVTTDQRSLSEAVTASRQGLIEMCMNDFHRNPLFGMGFQVAEYTAQRAAMNAGLVLSAPIEKGVIPIMILGETGMVGAIVFSAFLLFFYSGCSSKRLFLSLTMMTILLALNMGEATFFSPGGIGGPQWLFCIVGGYALDLSVKLRFGKGYKLA